VQPASTPSMDEDDLAASLHIGVGVTSPDSSDYGEVAIVIGGDSTSIASGFTSLEVYLHEPTQLPAWPILPHRCPVIQPKRDK